MSILNMSDQERIKLPLEVSRSILFRLSMNTGDFYKPLLQDLYRLREIGVPVEKIEQAASDITIDTMWYHSRLAQHLYNLLLEKAEQTS